jgi:hypothetical protein
MLCNKYEKLSHYERIVYIGELLHACQSVDYFFEQGEDIIKNAKRTGVFEGVIILPETINENESIKQETKID